MQASEARIRTAAVAGAILAVAPFAVLIGHLLLNSKPYKIVAQPLHAALVFAGVWLPLLVLLIAVVVGALIPQHHASLSPVVALPAAMLVAFGSVVLLTTTFGRAFQASGDFGTQAVIGAFFTTTLQMAVPLFAVAALLGWIIRRFRRSRVAAT